MAFHLDLGAAYPTCQIGSAGEYEAQHEGAYLDLLCCLEHLLGYLPIAQSLAQGHHPDRKREGGVQTRARTHTHRQEPCLELFRHEKLDENIATPWHRPEECGESVSQGSSYRLQPRPCKSHPARDWRPPATKYVYVSTRRLVASPQGLSNLDCDIVQGIVEGVDDLSHLLRRELLDIHEHVLDVTNEHRRPLMYLVTACQVSARDVA